MNSQAMLFIQGINIIIFPIKLHFFLFSFMDDKQKNKFFYSGRTNQVPPFPPRLLCFIFFSSNFCLEVQGFTPPPPNPS